MNGLQQVEAVRERYVEALRRAIRRSKEAGDFLGAEVVIRPNPPADDAGEGGGGGRGGPGAGGGMGGNTLITLDVLSGTAESPRPIVLMNEQPEGPLIGAISRGTIEVAVFPFLWEACRVWLRHGGGAGEAVDWGGVQGWFKRWFEERAQAGERDEDGLSGMVHFLSEPVAEGGGYLLEVDFGTAPMDAFVEFLEVLSDMGATDVRLGNSDGSDMEPEIAAELKSADLTPGRFGQLVAELVRGVEEVVRVEIPEPLVLRIHEEGLKEPFVSNLHNLWLLVQRTPAEQRPREVGRFLRGQRESTQYRKSGDKPDLASLRPVIKPTEFIEHIRQLAAVKKEEAFSLLCTRMVADLWIACVWDRPNGMQFVTAGEPEEFGLSREEAHARAIRNYLASPRTVKTEEEEGVMVARTHDNYDASLLLDNEFWTEVQSRLPGQVLACVPTRDVVLISSTETQGGEDRLRRLARRYVESGNHAISATVLRRVANVWQVQGHVPRPQEAPADPPKKKPWWKFW